MSDMDQNDEMNESWIETMRAEYNAPPETPREAMWAEIEGRLDQGDPDVIPIDPGSRPAARPAHRSWMGGLAAAAVLILIGVGLGRMTARPEADGTGPMAMDPAAAMAAPGFQTAAYRHLSRSESFLALVRTDARQGSIDADVESWSRRLLLETRLLMDSPAGEDVALQRLLRDLELILAQVAQVEGGTAPDEMALLSEALEEQDMIMRIRSVLPAGAAQAGL